MDNGASYLRMMAEQLIKMATSFIDEENRLDGISTESK